MNNAKNNAKKICAATFLATAWCFSSIAWAGTADEVASAGSVNKPAKKQLDRSGEPREGKASYYGKYFFGRTMADGTPMDPEANIAASRTLPLGSTAIVTNLENGKSEVVEIRDRGPYVDGRIIDVSPRVAEKLDMKEAGVASVVVTPIEVPQSDGSIMLGAGATDGATSSGQ
jgi:rare lipoprotein A